MNAKIKKYLEETMVLVEGGEFLMGGEYEQPIHKVELDSFWINKYPVTQELYEWVMGNNPSYFKGKLRPVERVDWFEILEFCNALSEKLGVEKFYSIENISKGKNDWQVKINENSKGYRLLAEAEWEYAAKGGKYWKDNFEFSGRSKLNEVGWNGENSHGETKEVGLKIPNRLGLYDVSGTIWERCWDWYGKYKNDVRNNHNGPEQGKNKVIRGGSWNDINVSCRVTNRNYLNPKSKDIYNGFRLSMTF